MPSCNTYRLTWVSLTLDVGYLFMACSSKAQSLLLTLDEGYLLTAAPPDLESGIAPLGPLMPVQPPLIGGGVAPPGHRILSPCLFNLYAEYIMRNAGLEETQAGVKIAGRNINNLRYADDTTLMAESEEELKSLLMKVKEESGKDGLKLNIQKTKLMASGSTISCQIDGETMETVIYFIFLSPQSTADGAHTH